MKGDMRGGPPVVALAIVDVQGPRRLVPAQYCFHSTLRRLRAAAEVGACKAAARRAFGRDNAQLPVEFAFARRQVRRPHCPEVPARKHPRPGVREIKEDSLDIILVY